MGRAFLRLRCGAWWAVLLFLAAATMTSAPAVAAPPNAGQPDMATRELLLERDVADLRSNAPLAIQASKEVAHVEAQQHAVNARVDDLKARIGDLQFLLTAIGIIAGLGAYFAADQKAKIVAKKWMDDHASELQKQITDLKAQADEISGKIVRHGSEVENLAQTTKEKIGGHVQEYEELLARAQAPLSTEKSADGASESAQISSSDHHALRLADEKLKEKAEKDYTARDWAQRASAASAEGAFERAALYFQQAADLSVDDLSAWARYTIKRGAALGFMQRNSEALAAFDAVVAHIGDASKDVLRKHVARALFNKGVSLSKLGRSNEAIAIYDTVVARFGDAPDDVLREHVARALYNKGAVLEILSRREDAIAAFDAIVARFSDAPANILREIVARALLGKGLLLGKSRRSEEAIAAFDVVVERFCDAREAALREVVAKALVNKGLVLGQLKRGEEAIAVFDAVVERYNNTPDASLRENVAKALLGKGLVHGVLGRSDEAITIYNAIVERFGAAEEDEIKEIVSRAVTKRDALIQVSAI